MYLLYLLLLGAGRMIQIVGRVVRCPVLAEGRLSKPGSRAGGPEAIEYIRVGQIDPESEPNHDSHHLPEADISQHDPRRHKQSFTMLSGRCPINPGEGPVGTDCHGKNGGSPSQNILVAHACGM